MTHFMLPRNPGDNDVGRYGDSSINKVLGALLTMDSRPDHYAARVYGGAAMVKGAAVDESSIGVRNVGLAREILRQRSIRIVAEDVGGTLGRKIDFLTDRDAVTCVLIQEQVTVSEAREPPRGAVRVLVVDDSATTRRVIRAGLEAAGMCVVGEAANAFEAREQILRRSPDVITLDLEMPMLDGISFLRKLMRHLPLPVVVVSSSAPSGSERAREALEAGAHSVVDKCDLDMSSTASNIGRVLVPRVRLAALGRLGAQRGGARGAG